MTELDPAQEVDEARPTEGEHDSRVDEERHVSFVQRLKRHYGDVDPEIQLEDVEGREESDEAREAERAGEDSSVSRELVRKLAGQVGQGSRYQVRRELARGGMGTILRVWDEDLRRNLAMKIMHSSRLLDEETSGAESYDKEKLLRFLEEAQITGQLDHPGIVPVHELGIDEAGRCYFTMRLVRGQELKEVLDLAREGGPNAGRWTITKALGLILKVCESMAFAHSKGVIHRDLKPANVMVGKYGEVYVMDWGLARVVGKRDAKRDDEREAARRRRRRRAEEASSLSLVRTVRKDESEANPDSPLVTMDGDVVGTPAYMALEQAQGKLEQVGPRSDIYSLGAILYYMLSGRAPYVEPGERVSPHTVLNRVLTGPPIPIRELAKDQPPELIAICEKAMDRDPGRRYQAMTEVSEDIQAYLEGRVVRAYEGGSIAEFKKWVVRNRGVAAAVCAMIVLSIASALGFAYQKALQAEESRRTAQELQLANEDAEAARDAAAASAEEAERNLVLAQRREAEAAENERLALEQEREARRSSYMANVTAANYSLMLNDAEEMRRRLQATDPRQREWEWDHLHLRAYPALRTFRSGREHAVDQVGWGLGGNQLFALSRDGHLAFLDPETGHVSPKSIEMPILTPGAGVLVAPSPLSLAVSPDGSILAIVGSDRKVRTYDVRTALPLAVFPDDGTEGHGSRISAICFSRDGRQLVTGADNGSIVLWSQDGAVVQRFEDDSDNPPGPIRSLAWSPDSVSFASASLDGAVRVWDVLLGPPPRRLRGHQGPVRCVAWGRDGEHLFSGGEDGMVNHWNGRRGGLVQSFSGHGGPIRAMAYERRGDRLVTASQDRTLRVWGVGDGSQTVLQGHVTAVHDVALSHDGERVVSGSEDGEIKVWDVRGDLAVTTLEFHSFGIEAVAFGPDGQYALTGDEEGELVLWDAYSGQPLRRLRDHTKAISAVVFDPETGSFYSASLDGTVRRYTTEAALHEATFAHDSPVIGLLMLPGGRLLTSCADQRVRIFDVRTQLLVEEYVAASRPVGELALRPGAESFAGVVGNRVLVRPVSGEEEGSILQHGEFLFDCAFSPDGTRLATASREEVCLWDVASGIRLRQRSDHRRTVRAVAFHPEGRRLASAGADETIRIRDAETAETILVLDWPGVQVTTLAFSPDGTRLLAGGDDGRVRIWETGDKGERRRRWVALRGIRDQVTPMVEGLFEGYFFVRDVLGQLQADASLDQELRQAAILLANLRGDDPRNLYRLSLDEALLPGSEPEVYDQALRRILAADQMEGADNIPAVHLARGVAQYRTGLVAEARESLELAQERSELPLAGSFEALSVEHSMIRWLFLAMVHSAEGHPAPAEQALESGRTLMTQRPDVVTQNPELLDLLKEAERVIEGA